MIKTIKRLAKHHDIKSIFIVKLIRVGKIVYIINILIKIIVTLSHNTFV